MKYLLDVTFKAAPIQIVVEAASMKDAWERRYDLAVDAEPLEWEIHPDSVEALDA
jgi:hypothetical protein